MNHFSPFFAKKKFIVLFFLLILFPFGKNYANSKKDSLITFLNKFHGVEKVHEIHKLIRKNFYPNPKFSKELSLKALQLSKEINNDSLIAYSYKYLGLAYYFMDYWNLSVENYKKSMNTKYAQRSSHFYAALANNIAIDYELLGEYDKSADYYFKALKIKEPQKDSLFIAKIYLNLGLLDLKVNKPDKAKEKFKFALPIFMKENDIRNVASSYQNLSIAECDLGNIDIAEKYFHKAIINSPDSFKTTEIYLDFSEGLFENKRYKKALKNYKLALSFSDSVATAATYYEIIKGIGKSFLFLGKVNDAEKYLLLSEKGLEKNDALLWLQPNKLNLAQLYAKKGDWEKFNHYLEEYTNLQEENAKKSELKTVEELGIIYETEKKDRQIEFQELEIINKDKIIMLISIIAFLVIIGLFVAIYLKRKLKFANKNLIEKNLELSERWNQLQKFYGSAESDPSKSTKNQLFHRIYQLMVKEQVYTKPDITVEYLSKQLSSNTKYISKAIKEETGMNFNTFINTFRIEEAKRILRDKISSTWSLDAVAEQSGFNNTTSFFQAFKKNTGLTPSAFRNALLTSFFE